MRALAPIVTLLALSACGLTEKQRDEARAIAGAVVEGQLYDGETITRLKSRISELEQRLDRAGIPR